MTSLVMEDSDSSVYVENDFLQGHSKRRFTISVRLNQLFLAPITVDFTKLFKYIITPF